MAHVPGKLVSLKTSASNGKRPPHHGGARSFGVGTSLFIAISTVLGYVGAFLKQLVNSLSSQSELWKTPCKAGGPKEALDTCAHRLQTMVTAPNMGVRWLTPGSGLGNGLGDVGSHCVSIT